MRARPQSTRSWRRELSRFDCPGRRAFRFSRAFTITIVASSLCVFSFSAAAAAGDPRPAVPTASNGATQYVIGPGDTLQIFVWNHPELTVTVPVRPDGQISMPLVENMTAAGKPASALSRDLEVKLAQYVRAPTVNVIITNALSTFSQVKVIGQVARPQALPYRQGMTVLDVLLAAGGLSEFAAGNRAKIVRSDNGAQHEIKVRLSDLLNKGDMQQNFPMRADDVLVVPESRF
jgi:polysaccharide biosynthesis/export protein